MPLAVQTLSVVARRRVEAAQGGSVTRGVREVWTEGTAEF